MNYILQGTGGPVRQQVGACNTFLCDFNADHTLPAPSAFNLLSGQQSLSRLILPALNLLILHPTGKK